MYRRLQKFNHPISKVLFNDLFDGQSFGRDRDEVTYFYVWGVFCVFCIYLDVTTNVAT